MLRDCGGGLLNFCLSRRAGVLTRGGHPGEPPGTPVSVTFTALGDVPNRCCLRRTAVGANADLLAHSSNPGDGHPTRRSEIDGSPCTKPTENRFLGEVWVNERG